MAPETPEPPTIESVVDQLADIVAELISRVEALEIR